MDFIVEADGSLLAMSLPATHSGSGGGRQMTSCCRGTRLAVFALFTFMAAACGDNARPPPPRAGTGSIGVRFLADAQEFGSVRIDVYAGEALVATRTITT